MKTYKYKGKELLLKDLFSLEGMNDNRVRRLIKHHDVKVGDDVSDIMNLSSWHEISTRNTGGKYIFRGHSLTYTEISKRIPLGVRSIRERILNSGLSFESDVSYLFSEFDIDLNIPESEKPLIRSVCNTLDLGKTHPFEAWAIEIGKEPIWFVRSLNLSGEGYYIFRSKRPSSKVIESASEVLSVSQNSLRKTFEYYRDLLVKRQEDYKEDLIDPIVDFVESNSISFSLAGPLCEGHMPIEAIRLSLGLSNKQFSNKIGYKEDFYISLKKTLRPHKKTLDILSYVSGIEKSTLSQLFKVCRDTHKENF